MKNSMKDYFCSFSPRLKQVDDWYLSISSFKKKQGCLKDTIP